MPNFICATCGTQYAEDDQPPAACAICQDERQYLKKTGQNWTTLKKLGLTNRNSLRFEKPGLLGIGIDPMATDTVVLAPYRSGMMAKRVWPSACQPLCLAVS